GGGFLRDREIYPDASRDRAVATAECREPASSDRLPVHRSESPTGYSSAGCSPAEPASASPVTENNSPISNPASQSKFRCSTSLRGGRQTRAPRTLANGGCPLYFARRVTF